jgi:hypothetical protein
MLHQNARRRRQPEVEGDVKASSPPAILDVGLRDSVFIGGVAYILCNINDNDILEELPTYFSQRCNINDILEPDDIAVFDMAEEEWRPELLWGPLRFAETTMRGACIMSTSTKSS